MTIYSQLLLHHQASAWWWNVLLKQIKIVNTSHPDREDGGGFYSKIGSKIGAGAAKIGKKVAQSEAGRSAGKAAIHGATEGARQDLTNRYLKQGEYGDSHTTPEPPKEPKSTSKPSESKSRSDDTVHHSSSSGGGDYSHSSTPSYRESRPPKPSIFSKLKGHSKEPPQRKAAPVQKDPKDRVYKHRLAKEPDWDRLTMAQALYNFKGEMKCDLEFRKGQVIQIITRTDKQFDWWEGKIDDRVGIFPANYVKIL